MPAPPLDVETSMKSMLGHLAFEVAVLRAQVLHLRAENEALKAVPATHADHDQNHQVRSSVVL